MDNLLNLQPKLIMGEKAFLLSQVQPPQKFLEAKHFLFSLQHFVMESSKLLLTIAANSSFQLSFC